MSEGQLRTLPGSRFSCRGCGKCCAGFSFGPVEPAVIDNLKAQDIASQWAPAAQGPWFETHDDGQGGTLFSLAHRDGHCVFLRDDKLCAVHALLGESAKPWFCREYPVRIIQDAKGLTATVRADCGGLSESFATGDPVEQHAAAALALPRPIPYPRFDPEHVVILPGLAIDPENWLSLEGPLLSKLTQGGARASTMRMRQVLCKVSGRSLASQGDGALVLAVCSVLDTLASASADEDTAARFTLVSQRISQSLPPEPSGSSADFYRRVVCSDLLGKRWASLGGVPAGMGLSVVECLAAQALGGPKALADVQRAVQLRECWAAMTQGREQLERVFLSC